MKWEYKSVKYEAAQRKATRPIAESIVLIWNASEAEEWADRIASLPF